ncbi:MAG: hypothetical protein KGP35_04705 [Bacteroidetes bacterium]|nr:hypothetical protein [Bacteroidota bacterium]
MKKTFLILLFITVAGFAVKSQSFKGHVSGMFGVINYKLRLQYERPIKTNASYGANLNYYMMIWKGPVIEPFMRIYGRRYGNKEGFFGQAKLIYGNLSTYDFEAYNGALKNKRWSTFGLGVGCGYKFLLRNQITIEPMFGFRFLTPPVYRFNSGVEGEFYANIGEGIAWYLTTGMPLDFQTKIGYQF